MAARPPEEIRHSIEANRTRSLVDRALRGEVAEITDWRKQLAERQRPAMFGAVIAGFLLGGGMAVFRRRRRG